MTMSKMIVLAMVCLSHLAFAAMPPSARIVGGQVAAKAQFPYQVSVRDSRNINNFNHLCAGVLIGYSEVLTAAHCVSDVPVDKLYIVAGTTALSLAVTGFVLANASQILIHEFFRETSYGNDIAFIRLAKSLPENRNDIRIIPLLSDFPKEGTDCTVSGWGDINGTSYSPTISPDLRFARVSYVSNSECKKRYLYVQTDGVCAAGAGNVGGPCGERDAGDPLVCQGGLLGLFSWSEGCAPGVPSVYTTIPFHLFWISEKMKQVTTTTKGTTKVTAGTTKATTKVTAGTTKATTKVTAGTTKATTKGTAGTTKATTKVTAGTTKATTKGTAGTTKATTKGTAGTTKATTKVTAGTTKATTKVTAGTTKATTKGTTKITAGTTKGTTKPTTASPNGSHMNSVNCFVVIATLSLVLLS